MNLMSCTRAHQAFLVMLLAAPGALAQDAFPVAGSYGFDWHQPDSAACNEVTQTQEKRFKPCAFHTSGAFGLPLAFYTCRLPHGGELMSFRTKSDCQEALETMNANAP